MWFVTQHTQDVRADRKTLYAQLTVIVVSTFIPNMTRMTKVREIAVAHLSGRPTTAQNFLDFMQFFGKFDKIVCWRSLQGRRPLLQGILYPAPEWWATQYDFVWGKFFFSGKSWANGRSIVARCEQALALIHSQQKLKRMRKRVSKKTTNIENFRTRFLSVRIGLVASTCQ